MGTTIASRWYEKRQEQGQRELLRKMLEVRFGPLSATAQERLKQLPAEQLDSFAEVLLRAQSLKELGLED
jgi:hypothetical protein